MPKVQDIYNFIDKIAPFSLKEEGDNSGLLVGRPDQEVKCITAVLDITESAVATSKELGADLIISHHPVIYRPQSGFLSGNLAFELAAAGMAAICAHTNLDAAENGVNDVLAEILGLKNITPVSTADNPAPMMRMGDVGSELKPEEAEKLLTLLPGSDFDASAILPDEFAALVKIRLGDCMVRYVRGNRPVRTAAVCGGAGSFLLDEIAGLGIDAFVTGDAKHHDFLKARALGITFIMAGHFNTEDPVISPFARRIAAEFPGVKMIRLKQVDPINVL